MVDIFVPLLFSLEGKIAALPSLGWRKQFRKVFFGKLFTSLGWFLHLLSNNLPLAVLVLFDRVEKRGALVSIKFSVMHVLVPMLLHTTLCAIGKRLGNLCPTVALISHLFETQLFVRRPWSIGAALLSGRRNRGSISTVSRGGGWGCRGRDGLRRD